MSGYPIRILLVEGIAADRSATVRALKQARLPSELHVAATRGDALAQLRASHFDVVLIETPLRADGTPPSPTAPENTGESADRPAGTHVTTDTELFCSLAPYLGDATPILLTACRDDSMATDGFHPSAQDILIKRSDRRHLDFLPPAVSRAFALCQTRRLVRKTYEGVLALWDRKAGDRRADPTDRLSWRDVVEGLPHALLVLQAAPARIEFVNRAAELLLGYGRDDLVGKSAELLVAPRHRGRAPLAPDGPPPSPDELDFEIDLQRKNGHQFRARLRYSQLDRESGGRSLVTLVRTDGRAQVEQRLVRQILELQRANTQLADFAHTVCHDLKAPLRAIHNLVARLEEESSRRDKGAALEPVQQLRDRVRGLDRLLDNLLKYALVGGMRSGREWVDCNGLLREIVELLGVPAAFPVVVRSELPRFETARTPLAQVLRNLIENAIKHHHRRTGRIEVEARDRGEFYEFCVRDDGPGIPREHRDRVFQLFPTHDANGERGGMGLAIIRKIVAQQGRRVRIATPPEGAGTAIHFEWNKRWSLRSDP